MTLIKIVDEYYECVACLSGRLHTPNAPKEK